ncbi:hypothetical protein B0T25DRAFT_25152 [Lasiosphaeria hispida]|uniref:Uncharacterized protein n=1 Tax=Lasiosphaeria hispida TaxID=260671 RepID=A0AAJ0MJN9_9PEZI|nr:hypothetical protein B0T25DRAFT_25152 [Lasiosphaeria hispida]
MRCLQPTALVRLRNARRLLSPVRQPFAPSAPHPSSHTRPLAQERWLKLTNGDSVAMLMGLLEGFPCSFLLHVAPLVFSNMHAVLALFFGPRSSSRESASPRCHSSRRDAALIYATFVIYLAATTRAVRVRTRAVITKSFLNDEDSGAVRTVRSASIRHASLLELHIA